jgi:crossover junction endodeoxyribonuclease RuvC
MLYRNEFAKDVVIGIDPGISGGISVIDKDTGIPISGKPMPVTKSKKNSIDPNGLASLLSQYDGGYVCDEKVYVVLLVIIEQVHSMPKQGVASVFSFGRSLGIIEGVVGTLGLPYQFVTPQRWKKVVLDGFANKDKNDSIAYCNRRWPGFDLKATERSRKSHDGIADALCMAEYGRRILCQSK